MSKNPINPNEETELVYQGRIRDGGFGNWSDSEHTVLRGKDTGLLFLSPFPVIDYDSSEYREKVNGEMSMQRFYELHDELQLGQYQQFRSLLKRGDTIADIGCGGGALLDHVGNIPARKIAIEPTLDFHPSLKERGYQVYNGAPAALADGLAEQVDLAVSFHVIEHVENPIDFLKDIHALVKPGGKAFIATPNLDDIMMKLDFDTFAPFNFRVVHNYYFSESSLRWVAEQAGWKVAKPVFYHEYSLSNTFNWLKQHRPCGNAPIEGVDKHADDLWASYLESTGQANNVALVLEK